MSNVIDQLAGLGTEAEQAAPADIARRDLLRGRAALRRRRFRRAVTGLGTTAAVAAAVVAVTATQSAPGTAPTAIQSSPSASPTATGFHLVSYTGPQIPGFNVEKLPEGYVLFGRGLGDPDPSLNAVYQDETGSGERWGKFIVAPQGAPFPPAPADGTAVEVNGKPATIVKLDMRTQIYYSDGSHELFMSCFGEGLTDEELVDFAESVSMTDDAATANG